MMNNSFTVTEYPTIQEAVEASNISIKYNPSVARRAMKRLDGGGNVVKVYLAKGRGLNGNDAVLYEYVTPGEGLRLLNELSLFSAVLTSSGFSYACVIRYMDSTVKIEIEQGNIPNTRATRAKLAKLNWLVTTVTS